VIAVAAVLAVAVGGSATLVTLSDSDPAPALAVSTGSATSAPASIRNTVKAGCLQRPGQVSHHHLADIDPDAISFTAVLGPVRAHLQADTWCPHCGRRPDDIRARLLADVIACTRNRAGRKRTSGRTPAERRTRHTDEAIYTITITPSNLLQWDKPLGI
jgi:hypothetical protein